MAMNFENLQFVRLTHPDMFRFIPRYLFEQVKDNTPDINIENLYLFGPAQLASEKTFLYIMFDGSNVIKGMLWAAINEFTDNLEVNILSVDNDYQGNSACKTSLDFLQDIKENHKLKKIRMMTTRGKAYTDKYERVYKKAGLKESNVVILEI